MAIDEFFYEERRWGKSGRHKLHAVEERRGESPDADDGPDPDPSKAAMATYPEDWAAALVGEINALVKGKGEFVNGTRLVYPMEDEAMRFLNFLANRTFSLIFSYLLNQRFTDTLCGTKALTREHYRRIADNRHYFGDFDPFGDFDLIFGAAKLNLKIIEIPIRYRARSYGSTQISRFRHGWLLLRMMVFAFRKLKAL